MAKGKAVIPDGFKLENLSISPAENGFTVSVSCRKKVPAKGMGSYESNYKSFNSVFESVDGVKAYVEKVLTGITQVKSKDPFDNIPSANTDDEA